MPIDEDPLASAAKGATLGMLEWTEAKVAEFALRFKNRELAFVQDAETISLVREERQSAEYERYKEFALTSEARIAIQMGLTLRRIQANAPAVKELRSRIYRRLGKRSLHLAQAVQAGVLALILEELLRQGLPPARYVGEVQQIIQHVDRYVWFVPKIADMALDPTEISMRLRIHKPLIFVISTIGSAKGIAAEVARLVGVSNPGYSIRLIPADWQHHYICIPSDALSPPPADLD